MAESVSESAVVCAVHQGGLSLLKRILRVISGALVRSAAARGEQLNARPYYRLFLGIIAELAPAFPADPQADPAPLSYIAMVALVLEELQPARVPGFAFPWLELISHRWAPRQLTTVSRLPIAAQTSLRGQELLEADGEGLPSSSWPCVCEKSWEPAVVPSFAFPCVLILFGSVGLDRAMHTVCSVCAPSGDALHIQELTALLAAGT